MIHAHICLAAPPVAAAPFALLISRADSAGACMPTTSKLNSTLSTLLWATKAWGRAGGGAAQSALQNALAPPSSKPAEKDCTSSWMDRQQQHLLACAVCLPSARCPPCLACGTPQRQSDGLPCSQAPALSVQGRAAPSIYRNADSERHAWLQCKSSPCFTDSSA